MFNRNSKSYLLCERGTTLVELLIYISILSIITLSTTALFEALSRAKNVADSLNIVNTNMRFAQTIIANDIRAASVVNIPVLAGGGAPTLSLVVGADTITYDVMSSQLRRTINAGTSTIITTPNVLIDGLYFTRFGNVNAVLGKTTTSIQYGMTVTFNSTSPGQIYSTNGTTTVALLN